MKKIVLLLPFLFFIHYLSASTAHGMHTDLMDSYLFTDTVIIVETLCFGECLELNDTEFCESGSYEVIVENEEESTFYQLELTVSHSIQTYFEATICEGECYQFGSDEYCESGIYGITFIAVDGCDSLVAINLTVLENSIPDITIGNTDPLDCINTSVQLLTNSSYSGLSYFWEGPGIDESNESQQSPEVSVSGIYSVTVATANGCTNSASTEVLGSPALPEIDIAGNDPLNCNNPKNVITASSSTHHIVDFEWVRDGILITSGSQITVSEPGVFQLYATSGMGCISLVQVEVVENEEALFVDAGPNRHIKCEFVLQLDAPGAAGDNIAYEWTTEDGNILNGANTLNPLINVAGTYTLTAIDPHNGCTGTDEVIVYNSLTVIPDNVFFMTCLINELVIDASESYSGTDAFIQWTTSTGHIVEGANSLTILVDAPGSYQLVIFRPGCVDFSTAVVLDQTFPPAVNIQSDANNLTCQNPSIELNADINTYNATFNWTLDGAPLSSDQNITAFDPGTYEVVVSNQSGCSNSASVQIGSDAEPDEVFILGETQLDCTQNGVGTLSASSSTDDGSYIYTWSTEGGEIVSALQAQTIDILGQGTYCVEVFNPANGCLKADCVDVTAVSNIEVGVAITDASCAEVSNGSVEITSTSGGTPPYSFSWSNGEVETTVLSGLAPGDYWVTISDNDGCFDTERIQIGVADNLSIVADAGADQNFDCSGSFLILDGSNSEYPDDAVIEWTTADGNILGSADTPYPYIGAPGTYVLHISDLAGCAVSDEVTVFSITANAGPDRFINCNVPSTNLDGSQSQGGATYLWTTLDGNIVEGETTLTPLINATGTYTLIVNSPDGCTATSSTQVIGDFAQPEINANDQILLSCTDPLILTATSSISGTTFEWAGPGGVLTGQNPEIFDVGTYTVEATAPNGCSTTLDVEVTDDRFYPSVTGEPVQNLNCFNGIPFAIEVDFESQNGVAATWSTNNGNIVSQDNELVMVDAAGIYDLVFTDMDSDCENTASFTVTEEGLAITTTSTTTSCGENDGTAGVMTEGINYPQFEWSNGATTASVEGLAPGFYTVTISAAPGTCVEERTFEILQDPSCLVLVSGTIYDDDSSSDCDPAGDVTPADGVLVHILPVDEYTSTDENGYYEFLVPAGQYTIEVLPVSPWVVNCPSAEVIDLDLPPGIAEAPNNDFFLEALSGFDLYGYAFSGGPVAGNTQFYQLTYCNNAFQTIHGTVELTHDPLLTGFDMEASGASSYDPSTYTATWSFEDLSFFECEYISFHLTVPADIPDGTVLSSSMLINPAFGDISASNNSYSWNKVAQNTTMAASIGEPTELPKLAQASRNVLLQNQPNPFKGETLIPFYIHTDEHAKLLLFDANGRLVKQYEGFEKGYNSIRIQSANLSGNGIYFYRLVTEKESLTGRMILME